jgi:signal transduction histidine kinase
MPTLLRLLKPSLGSLRFSIGAVLSLSGGVTLFVLTAGAIESDAESRFRSMARIASYSIEARIKSYTDVLRSTAGLFHADPDTTAEQFHNYVEQLEIKKNFPGIEVINYATAVDESGRAAVEEQVRQRLRQLGVDRPVHITPREPGSIYTIITYIEPVEKSSVSKFGMDLGWRKYTSKTLADARDSNTIAASGTRVNILSGPNRHGLAMRLPVYRPNMPLDTVEQRRAAYFGTVGIGFGVNSLIAGVLETLPIKGTRLTVTDMTPVPAEQGDSQQPTRMFDSSFGRPSSPPVWLVWHTDVLHVQLPVVFNKRTWMTDFSIQRRNLYSQFDAYYPWLAGLAGSMSIALLYALFQTLAASRRHAIHLAEEMTRELRTSQANLQASHEKLRRLTAHTEQIKEHERKRIAREIHDDLGQSLLAVRIDAEMLTSRTRSQSRLHARAETTLHQIDATIQSVRQIINDLRPNVLDLGLNAAVDWQIAQFKRRTGIACHLIEHERDLRVDDQSATALFRILQESLNNITRHANATEVHIELHLHDDVLSMAIHDNGVGLRPGSRNRPGSFGLVGIEERVNILGGKFSVSSTPGAGTTLLVKVPVSPHPEPEPEPGTAPPADVGASSEQLPA